MSKVVFDRHGQSGNIFYILGMAYAALLKEERKPDAEQMCARVLECGSYEESLEIIAEYVDLMEANDEYVY